jgi:predicted aspartyl protease
MAATDEELLVNLNQMSVPEMRQLLNERGMATKGSKKVLKERLHDVLAIPSGSKKHVEGDGNVPQPNEVDAEDEEVVIDALTMKELRFRLRRLGLGTSGVEADLKKRLKEALQDMHEDEVRSSELARQIHSQNDEEFQGQRSTMYTDRQTSERRSERVFQSQREEERRNLPEDGRTHTRRTAWHERHHEEDEDGRRSAMYTDRPTFERRSEAALQPQGESRGTYQHEDRRTLARRTAWHDEHEASAGRSRFDHNEDNESYYDHEREEPLPIQRGFQLMTFKDVEGTLDTFSGDDGRNVQQWLDEFEDTAQLCHWSDMHKALYARKLLRGSAKLYVSYEGCKQSWSALKHALFNEFGPRVDSHTIHRTLQQRKKQTNETYHEYCYKMLEIGSQAKIETQAIIQYIIDGIEGDESNKVVLYGAKDVKELKEKLDIYERMRSKNKKPINVDKRGFAPVTNEKRSDNCFNCGLKGHSWRNCPNKDKGPKCFKCDTFGHRSADCTKALQKSKNIERRSCNLVRANETKCYKTVSLNGTNVKALLDTGSDLTIIRTDCYVKIGAPNLENESIKFTGIGSGNLHTLGIAEVTMNVDDDDFDLKMHIVAESVTKHDMILGNDFLKTVELNYKHGDAKISKLNDEPESEICKIDCIVEEDVDLSHINDENVKHNVKQMIEAYTPTNEKQVDMKARIILNDDTPVAQCARRLAHVEKEIVNKQIAEWLDDGIIRQSTSDYASPVVLVKKKDKSSRLCIDYRKLNSKVVKIRYPLPFIDDQLDKLKAASLFTTLDLKNGFFHVSIEDGDCKFTSFVVPGGQYEFTKLPFGLCNSPAYFQKYINSVFKSLVESGVVILYMDDLIIPSVDINEGKERFSRVLTRASEYGLKINWKKCQILKSNVNFLGYVIEKGSIKPSVEKTKAVQGFPEPKNVRNVQSFLGLTGFFRKFILNYAIIARPLTELTKNDVEFRFDLKERGAFNALKNALCTQPVLALYCPFAETELHTDASALGLGAILLQKDSEDRQMHPIHFASWKTTRHEERYSSYKLEVLAVVRALKKFRSYLVGISFKIVTDCKAFTQTMTKKDICPQIARWALNLEEFKYTLEHKEGKKMQHVDALSRYPVPNVCVIDDCEESVTARLRRCQQQDEELTPLVEKAKNEEHDDYEIKGGLLYKRLNSENLLVVPKAMQDEVIRRCHDQGHFGAAKTAQLVKREYWFNDLDAKIKSIIQNCVPCILAERKQGKSEGFLHTIDKGDVPMDTYHVDHLGPLPSTKKKYGHILAVIDGFTKFTWLYSTRSTGAAEVVEKLLCQSAVFGNPKRIITDRGSAFRSDEFRQYCQDEDIHHSMIVTGVARGNGQIERINRMIIPVLTKLSAANPGDWHKYVRTTQQYINHVIARSTGYSPFKLTFGVDMRLKEDKRILQIINEEETQAFMEERDNLRSKAKENIARIQDENRKTYNKKRKVAPVYNENDLVAIKRTQGGPGLKFCSKFLGPYSITRVLRGDRYLVQKVGQGEGPKATSTSVDFMKPWAK